MNTLGSLMTGVPDVSHVQPRIYAPIIEPCVAGQPPNSQPPPHAPRQPPCLYKSYRIPVELQC